MEINYDNDKLLPAFSIKTLKDRYMLPDEASPQDCFARAASAYATDREHAQRMYTYISRLWFMPSSPIISNAGTKRGLPISCFLNYVDDSINSILDNYVENSRLTINGGGIGTYWGKLRTDGTATSHGSKSNGVIPFMACVDRQMLAFSQGVTRRGAAAVYIDISHPEIEEFLDLRKPTGDSNRRCLNLHHGVNIPNEFLDAVRRGNDWELKDPHTNKAVNTIPARELWEKLLKVRHETGEPYMVFIDTCNEAMPACQKEKGLKIYQSNLCTEIILPTSPTRTAVCCLSSVNLDKWDEWKGDAQFIADCVEFLDNTLDAFIEQAYAMKGMERAVFSAQQERSIGLGTMGFHSLLQSKGIPFESALAKSLNMNIFKHIRAAAEAATVNLAIERGKAPDETINRRNVHLLAVAPNATSSIICGNTSGGIEPYSSNVVVQKTNSGTNYLKNPWLARLLSERKQDTDDVWASIAEASGSVQGLDLLTKDEKDVFKTAFEINQRWVIDLAADRQKFIDQGQSVNLFFPADVDAKYLHHVHWDAATKGLKSLYYIRSESIDKSAEIDYKECLACEG